MVREGRLGGSPGGAIWGVHAPKAKRWSDGGGVHALWTPGGCVIPVHWRAHGLFQICFVRGSAKNGRLMSTPPRGAVGGPLGPLLAPTAPHGGHKSMVPKARGVPDSKRVGPGRPSERALVWAGLVGDLYPILLNNICTSTRLAAKGRPWGRNTGEYSAKNRAWGIVRNNGE